MQHEFTKWFVRKAYGKQLAVGVRHSDEKKIVMNFFLETKTSRIVFFHNFSSFSKNFPTKISFLQK